MAGKNSNSNSSKYPPQAYAQPYAAPSGSYQHQYPPTAYPPSGYPQHQAGYNYYPQQHYGHQGGGSSSSSSSHLIATGAAAAVGAAVGTAAVGGIHHTTNKIHRKVHQAGHLIGNLVGAAVRPPHVHVPHIGHIPGLHIRPHGPHHHHGPRP